MMLSHAAAARQLTAWAMALVTVATHAQQTDWPASIGRLTRQVSTSPIKAELPAPVVVTPPAEGLPESQKKFSGTWSGWACQRSACDWKLAVERVDETGATVAFSHGSAEGGLKQDRAEGKFVGAELHVPLNSMGTTLVLRLRDNGDMEALQQKAARVLTFGWLSKTPTHYSRQTVRVPTPYTEDGKSLTLEMVVYRPTSALPDQAIPTLVFNHGSTGRGDKAEWFKLTWESAAIGNYFAAKGWQVLFPQRRGRGASDGLYDEGFEPDRSRYLFCPADVPAPGFERALSDIDVVMAYVRTQPGIDKQRLLMGGQSRGGILSVVYAGEHPDQFQGVLNFVGGWTNGNCAGVSSAHFKRGAGMKKSMLWLYGEDDSFYSISHSQGNFDAFKAAGGQGEFLTFKVPGNRNGHMLQGFPELWHTSVDAYLQKLPSSKN